MSGRPAIPRWRKSATATRLVRGFSGPARAYRPGGPAARRARRRRRGRGVDDADRQGVKAGYLQALRGDIAAVQNNRQAALDAYGKALAMEDSRTHRMVLARAQAAYGDLKAAIATLDGWLAKNPQDVATRHVQLNWQVWPDNYDAAVKGYEALLKDNDKDVLALNNLAMVLRGKDDRGRSSWRARRRTRAEVVCDHGHPGAAAHGYRRPARRHASCWMPPSRRPLMLPCCTCTWRRCRPRSGDKAAARAALEKLLEAQARFAERAEAEALLATLK